MATMDHLQAALKELRRAYYKAKREFPGNEHALLQIESAGWVVKDAIEQLPREVEVITYEVGHVANED